MSKRDLVFTALAGEKVERVPVGFWHHFLTDELAADALADPTVADKNVAGHRQFIRSFQPDFIKLMSDGYFRYPEESIEQVGVIADLAQIKGLSPVHPWYLQQTNLVRRQREQFVEDIVSFYNIFSPVTLLKWQLPGGEAQLVDLILTDQSAVAQALQVIAADVARLSRLVIEEGGTDGIYFSAQNLQDSRLTPELYQEVFAPAEITVLTAAEKAGGKNILHICGYEGAKNNLTIYQEYPAVAVNWAVTVEGISLEEGRQLFGKSVIGGFANTTAGVLYSGSEAEITAETQRLLAAAGTTGILLGADCTVPLDTPAERFEWVRNAAAAFTLNETATPLSV